MYLDNPEIQQKKAEATKAKREKIVFGGKPYRCTKCGLLKDPKDFVVQWLDNYWVWKYRYLYECKQCKKDRIYNKRAKDRETIDGALEIIIKQLEQWAKKRKISFNITIDDLLKLREKQGGNCYYTGYSMDFWYIGFKDWKESDKVKYQVSCDRIDNVIGYQRGNIVLCCTIANKMKNNLTPKEFYKICKDISEKNS